MNKIFLATQNQHKIQEIETILSQDGFQFLSLNDFPNMPNVEEDGNTFLANAIKKAKVGFEYTGLPTLADDSGLEVDYLEGLPGVISARFAGEHGDAKANNQKLLNCLQDVPREKRKARFRCVVAFVFKHFEIWAEGTTEGFILTSSHGEKGFGYDPLFFYPPAGKTFAEMSEDEKNSVSHRGKAFRAMAEKLRQLKE